MSKHTNLDKAPRRTQLYIWISTALYGRARGIELLRENVRRSGQP